MRTLTLCVYIYAHIQVQEMVTWPMAHAQAFRRLGIAPPTGLLLYGPPGTGKTLVAKAAACQVRCFAWPLPGMIRSPGYKEIHSARVHPNPRHMTHTPPQPNISIPPQTQHQQTGAAFLALRISDIVRGEIGTAEIALRDAFRAAVRSRPALIFIDEFQVCCWRVLGSGVAINSGVCTCFSGRGGECFGSTW